MTHCPLVLSDLSLSYPQKVCFERFSAEIRDGQRIGILGKNGSGKSTLLRMILALQETGVSFGYVPQIIEDFYCLSGGQRFNKALSLALAQNPEVLCLDEPTNHLDQKNRRSLIRMLQSFRGTLIVATHDVELLRHCVDRLWHIDDGGIKTFNGPYDDYLTQSVKQRQSLEAKLAQLDSDRKLAHDKLMRDQERAKKKRVHGEKKYDGDTIALRGAQGRGERTTNKHRKKIGADKAEVLSELSALRLPDVIKPKFSLTPANQNSRKTIVSISGASCGYDTMVLRNIHLQLKGGERLLISGDNGCGKTTLVKAILGDERVRREGNWLAPSPVDIGYLDQHYATLNPNACAIDLIREVAPGYTMLEIREHLNAFLFRKNEEVNTQVLHLSGGEKARLSLAIIAAKTPKLLVLDEITNNVDNDTREHVIQVLREYPGAMIIISHDEEFVKRIGVLRVEFLVGLSMT